jgi:hypothetical protein
LNQGDVHIKKDIFPNCLERSVKNGLVKKSGRLPNEKQGLPEKSGRLTGKKLVGWIGILRLINSKLVIWSR